MAVKPGEMIIQVAYLNVERFPIPNLGFARVYMLSGWSNDSSAPTDRLSGRLLIQFSNGQMFEDRTADEARFGTMAADVAEVVHIGGIGPIGNPQSDALAVVFVDDVNNQARIQMYGPATPSIQPTVEETSTRRGNRSLLWDTGLVQLEPSNLFVTQKYAPGDPIIQNPL